MTTSLSWKSAMTWGLLGLVLLLFALVFGPAPAVAGGMDKNVDAVLYEVTEDMYLKDALGNFVKDPASAARRMAVAQLSGWAKVGTPLCPNWVLLFVPTAKRCTVNATGADDLSLANGKGTVAGSFAVVVQGDNLVDGPEFVIMTGTFYGEADLGLALLGQAPLGFITNGTATIDGYDGEVAFAFKATFRLPFSLDAVGRHGKPRRDRDAYYLNDRGRRVRVQSDERSLGVPTVRLELSF
jgi:hypothetical protein